MKKLKALKNPAVGTQCVVSEVADTPIYTIKAINDYIAGGQRHVMATLEYPESGRMVSGGDHPLSCCYQPSNEQVKYQAAQATNKGTLQYVREAKKGKDGADGLLYIHHWKTGYQELIMVSEAHADAFGKAEQVAVTHKSK
jgi:hypothetical protein